jgi:2-polyprenyl-3-methyl-5-hydroxy-6-metoxy-1,4-benzoquinol methylase
VSCPLCDGASSPVFSTPDRNRRLSDQLFHYRRCERCSAIFLANAPEDLGRFYPDSYYALPSADELERGRAAEAHKLALVGEPRGGRLVEIGPGAGWFAYAARSAGFEVATIEMDARACEHLRAVVGVEALQSDLPHAALEALPPSRAIALWHVLEHLREPWLCIESAARNLESGGTLVVALPNPDSLQLRLLGGRWPHIDAPRHLYLLPGRELLARTKRAGLDCVHLTSRDRSGIYWNRFGWQQLLMRPEASKARTAFALAFGVLASALASPIELRNLRGATYTAVFRKR